MRLSCPLHSRGDWLSRHMMTNAQSCLLYLLKKPVLDLPRQRSMHVVYLMSTHLSMFETTRILDGFDAKPARHLAIHTTFLVWHGFCACCLKSQMLYAIKLVSIKSNHSRLQVSILTNPVWVIKTRLQLQRSGGLVNKSARPLRSSHLGKPFRGSPYRGFLHAVRQIASEEGWRGFYRGLWPSLLLVGNICHGAHQWAICLVVFTSAAFASDQAWPASLFTSNLLAGYAALALANVHVLCTWLLPVLPDEDVKSCW